MAEDKSFRELIKEVKELNKSITQQKEELVDAQNRTTEMVTRRLTKAQTEQLNKDNEQIKKVAAIGVRISKWIAYHGFSININNNLDKYKAIIPCGIKDKGITNLKQIKDQDYKELEKKLVEIFISNLNK